MPDPYPLPPTGAAGGACPTAGTPEEGTSVLQAAQNAAGAVADRAKDLASSVADSTRHMASQVRDTAESAWESTSEYTSDQFENLTCWVKRNPRTALALGFALGCCIGYCLVTMRKR